jgi:hypothetical protein
VGAEDITSRVAPTLILLWLICFRFRVDLRGDSGADADAVVSFFLVEAVEFSEDGFVAAAAAAGVAMLVAGDSAGVDSFGAAVSDFFCADAPRFASRDGRTAFRPGDDARFLVGVCIVESLLEVLSDVGSSPVVPDFSSESSPVVSAAASLSRTRSSTEAEAFISASFGGTDSVATSVSSDSLIFSLADEAAGDVFFFALATGRNPGRCFLEVFLELRGTNDTTSVEDDMINSHNYVAPGKRSARFLFSPTALMALMVLKLLLATVG